MSIHYDGNFTTPRQQGSPILIQDFEDSLQVTSIETDVLVATTAYAALTANAVTSFAAATYYYQGDRGFSDLGGGLTKFTRAFSLVPSTRIVPGGTYATTIYGLTSTTTGTSQSVTVSLATATSNPVVAVTMTAHGFTTGDFCLLDFRYTAVNLGITYSRRFVGSVAVTVTGTDTFTFRFFDILGWFSASFVSGTGRAFSPARQPKTEVVPTLIQFDYALPGVTPNITTALDFGSAKIFQPINAGSGTDTQSLDAGTVPTAAEFRAMIAAGELIVAESAVQTWKGRILERRTVLLRAQ
jgi:hypothetical protein